MLLCYLGSELSGAESIWSGLEESGDVIVVCVLCSWISDLVSCDFLYPASPADVMIIMDDCVIISEDFIKHPYMNVMQLTMPVTRASIADRLVLPVMVFDVASVKLNLFLLNSIV